VTAVAPGGTGTSTRTFSLRLYRRSAVATNCCFVIGPARDRRGDATAVSEAGSTTRAESVNGNVLPTGVSLARTSRSPASSGASVVASSIVAVRAPAAMSTSCCASVVPLLDVTVTASVPPFATDTSPFANGSRSVVSQMRPVRAAAPPLAWKKYAARVCHG